MNRTTRTGLIALASASLLLGIAAPVSATPSPTDLVADIVAGAGGSDPYYLTAFSGRLYFVANDGSGDDLFVSDGSVGSATNLNLNASGASNPYGFTVIGSTLYFGADDGVNGTELWSITGTAAPVLVADIESGAGDSDPNGFTLYNGDIYFQAYSGVTGQSLFRLSGGTVSAYPMGAVQAPDDFFVYNGLLYFSASVGSNIQLFRIDGTNPPSMFFDSNPTGFGNPHRFAIAGGILYFLSNDGANNPSYNYELYATDGVAVPTQLTTDLSDNNGYQYYAVYNDTLYFSAGNASVGRELGHTTSGTVPTYFDIFPGATGSFSEGFTAYNGSLYFTATTSATGFEMFSVTGAGAPTLRADLAAGAGNSFPYDFVVSNGRLAFAAASDGTNWQLWSFDGTTANQESAIVSADADVFGLTVMGNYVYYSAESTANGYEVWRTRIAAAAAAAPGLANGGAESAIPAGIAAALLLAGLALTLLRRRSAHRVA